MVKQEDVVKLIKDGFDLELISFELDIPMERLVQLKGKLENTGNKKIVTKVTKMEIMREKYNDLYFQSSSKKVQLSKQIPSKDIELTEKIIVDIDEKISEIKKSPQSIRGANLNILAYLKKIDNVEMKLEQAERLIDLLSSKELRSEKDTLIYLNTARKKIISKFAKIISDKVSQSESIEELEDLKRIISETIVQNKHVSIENVRDAISRKIANIKQKQVLDRMKNDIPNSIMQIITDLANGKLDIKTANEIIEAEAQKRVSNKPKTYFSLTEEQEKRQILIQVRKTIREQGDKYKVQDPELTIVQLQELCMGEKEQAVSAVVNNLISSKKFNQAREICERHLGKEEKLIVRLKNEIRNAEISQFVLDGINRKGTLEEETAYFNLIERGLERFKVRAESISLGKSEDGLKDITLADIWPNSKEEKAR